jgi:hypothetical protein
MLKSKDWTLEAVLLSVGSRTGHSSGTHAGHVWLQRAGQPQIWRVEVQSGKSEWPNYTVRKAW